MGSITGTVLNNLLYAFTVLGVYLLDHPTYAPLRNPKTDKLLPGRGVPAALAQIGTVLAHAALVWLCAAATREYLGGGFGRVGAAIRARLGGDRAGAGSSGWEVVAGGGASGAGDSAGAMLQAHEVRRGAKCQSRHFEWQRGTYFRVSGFEFDLISFGLFCLPRRWLAGWSAPATHCG